MMCCRILSGRLDERWSKIAWVEVASAEGALKGESAFGGRFVSSKRGSEFSIECDP